jgi:hypothetical protein
MSENAGPQWDYSDDWRAWWRQLTEADIAATAPKATEYSSADLTIMGDALRQWHPTGAHDASAGEEMAVVFYLLGKIARAIGAYREGHLPSDDTLDDIRIYAVMLTRIRQKGTWPA